MACSGGSHPHLKYRFPGSSVFSTAGIPADIGRQYDISTFFIGAVPGSSGIHRLKVQKSLYPTGCGLLSAGTVRTSPSPGTRDNLLSYRHPSRAFLPDSLLDFQRGPGLWRQLNGFDLRAVSWLLQDSHSGIGSLFLCGAALHFPSFSWKGGQENSASISPFPFFGRHALGNSFLAGIWRTLI